VLVGATEAYKTLRAAYVAWASARLERRLDLGEYFWTFVLGVNNSGTTILARVLETHPSIRSLPQEGQLLTNAFPRPDHLGVTRIWSSRMDVFRWTEADDPYPALRAKRDWAKFFPRRPGILLEKSPPNTVRARWLQRNFSPSRFLAVVRNPYAVCEGIRRRHDYSIEMAAKHWLCANECLFADMKLLEKAMLFKYEDFTEMPEEYLKKIQIFLELREPFDFSMWSSAFAHSAEGNTSGIKNLNEESLSRLSGEDIVTINRIAEKFMTTLGYPVLQQNTLEEKEAMARKHELPLH
jgi:hypothetical protein